jgi:hypothetical protein
MRTAALEARLLYPISNVTPVWLLPFWRLLRGQAKGDIRAAFNLLPAALPAGVLAPSVEEFAVALVDHQLVY